MQTSMECYLILIFCAKQQQRCLRHSFSSHVYNAASPARHAEDYLFALQKSFFCHSSLTRYACRREEARQGDSKGCGYFTTETDSLT